MHSDIFLIISFISTFKQYKYYLCYFIYMLTQCVKGTERILSALAFTQQFIQTTFTMQRMKYLHSFLSEFFVCLSWDLLHKYFNPCFQGFVLGDFCALLSHSSRAACTRMQNSRYWNKIFSGF